MYFSDVEEEVIRHPAFNRLADLKQLGYAYKAAFKCATHSRLSHALGTSYLAKKIWREVIKKARKINSNKKRSSIFPNNEELNELENMQELVGVASLLHDIMHLPYMYAIKDHLDLSDFMFSKEYIESRIDEFSDCKLFNYEMREEVKNILIKERHKNFKYSKLIYFLIRGDAGASCIDYVVRDHFEVGFKKPDLYYHPERVFILVKKNHTVYLALDLRENDKPLTYLTLLMLMRYKLAEQVYFHYTITSAEAMIGKCLRKIVLINDINNPEIIENFLKTHDYDEKLISALENYPNDEVSDIGQALRERQLYKDAFKLSAMNPNLNRELRSMLCEQFRGFHNISRCMQLEKAISKRIGVNENEIIIYCHSPDMFSFNVKDMLTVLPELEIIEFDNLSREKYMEVDIINQIRNRHQKLWAFYVFSKRRDDKTLKKIKKLCEEIFSSKKSLLKFLEGSRKEFKAKLKQKISNKKIFISYSHLDKSFAVKLKTKLEEKKLDIFLAETELRPGDQWPKEIEINLKTRDVFILIWSKNAKKSKWVYAEIAYAVKNINKIFVVCLDNCEIQPLLADRQAIFHSSLENTVNEILKGLGIS